MSAFVSTTLLSPARSFSIPKAYDPLTSTLGGGEGEEVVLTCFYIDVGQHSRRT